MEMSDVIAGLALVVSIGSTAFSFRRQRRLDGERFNELELIRVQLSELKNSKNEKLKAKVSAKLINVGKSYRVKVFNTGSADARDVSIRAHDDGSLVQQDTLDEKFPLARLESQSSIEVWSSVGSGMGVKQTISITWEDETSSTNENIVELVL